MKTKMCDICLSKNIIKRSRVRIGFTGTEKLDLCPQCEKDVEKINVEDFKKLVSSLTDGILKSDYLNYKN